MLALRMGRTLDELYATMSSQEFSMWVALYNQDRWGDELNDLRADLRAGKICATIANYAGKTIRKGEKAMTPADFMPSLATPEEPVAEPDPVAHFKLIAATKPPNK